MKYAKGIMWLDDCRIPILDEKILVKSYSSNAMDIWYDKNKGERQPDTIKTNGRFTPNLLVCDDLLNDGVVRKGFNGGGGPTRFAGAIGGKKLDDYNYYGDNGSSSRFYDLDKWFDKMLERI
jgi:hypothetical protein